MKTITQCARCILDTTDTKYISFDSDSVCSYCHYYDSKVNEYGDELAKGKFLENKIKEIKIAGQNKKYDCILGLSGGIDSSYLAMLAHQYELRPLVIHLDNGWNSDIAVKNIEKICEKFGFELYTYVIDWEEFVGLQKAYLRAGVIDIEVLTDHAIYAVLQKLASKFNIKYTLSGFNVETEAVMPKGWTYNKRDFLNIKDIIAKYGEGIKFKTYPYVSFYKALYYFWFLKLETFEMLNYINYDKDKAKIKLIEDVGWEDYGGKHFESIFTKFYQLYILPQKFGVDKRRAHLSNLLCAGKINKIEATKKLQESLYDESIIRGEMEYVLKKFNLTEEQFNDILNQEPRSHFDFDTDQRLWNRYYSLIHKIKFWKKRY
jgi:N-acetyl sugar amidotransferase